MYGTRLFYIYSSDSKLPIPKEMIYRTATYKKGLEDLYWDSLEDVSVCEWFPDVNTPSIYVLGTPNGETKGFLFTIKVPNSTRKCYILAAIVEIPSLAEYLEGKPEVSSMD